MDAKDFLFELGCEELPPKALPKLASALLTSLKESFGTFELNYSDCEWFATPRRLAVRFIELDIAQKDKQVEKLGPAVSAAFDDKGSPKPAALGFAKSNGVEVTDLSRKQTDKGERLAFVALVKGKTTLSLLQDSIQKAISQLPIPKAMKWGNNSFQFSRPVHWLVAILGNEIVPLELFGKTASNLSYGHRFHSPESITLSNAGDYEKSLSEAKVVCCFEERKAKIRIQVDKIAKTIGARAVVSEDLLEEVAALVEWPVALLGNFSESFLQVPSEALISSMAEHQKYFHLVDENNQLMPHFITVANIESKNPSVVIDGNEKVIRPRLADAKFFYDSDCKYPLSDHIGRLKKIVFQNKLGSLYDKSQRVKNLALYIAEELKADKQLVSRAADLCKCDLVTDMVGEFSDLQGIMGRYYATKDGEPTEVAAAMDEIYMPRFAGDKLPESTTGLILAIAERIDTLVGIFGIGQLPTGTKDPFALRRSSLGVLRLIVENKLALDLNELMIKSIATFSEIKLSSDTCEELLKFFSNRSYVMFQERGISTPVIKAVQSLNITQPTDFSHRLAAVEKFHNQPESSDLAEANKRVKNILAKSNFESGKIKIDNDLFEEDEEALYNTIEEVRDYVNQQISKSNYSNALDRLAGLKNVVNQFFDNVLINAEDPKIRNNRLALINELRNLFIGIADISLLQK